MRAIVIACIVAVSITGAWAVIAAPGDGIIQGDRTSGKAITPSSVTTTGAITSGGLLTCSAGSSGCESDPQIETITASKWCVANVGGTAADCTTNAPTVAIDPNPTLGADLDISTYDIKNGAPKTTNAATDASTMKCGQDSYWAATGVTNILGGSCSLGAGIGARKVQCTSFDATADGDTLDIKVYKDGVATTTTLTAKNTGAGASQWNCVTSSDVCCTNLNAYIVANPITGITSTSNATASYVGFVPSADVEDIRLVITEAGGGGAPVFGTATNSDNGSVLMGSAAQATYTKAALSVVNGDNTLSANPTVMGIAGSSVAASGTNIGVYGVGRATGATGSPMGGSFVADVGNTADSSVAIGVQGAANATHAGGNNIGVRGSATNGAVNYALYALAGDTYFGAGNLTSTGNQTWTLKDNTSTALSIGASGAASILTVNTTDSAETVSLGAYDLTFLGATGALATYDELGATCGSRTDDASSVNRAINSSDVWPFAAAAKVPGNLILRGGLDSKTVGCVQATCDATDTVIVTRTINGTSTVNTLTYGTDFCAGTLCTDPATAVLDNEAMATSLAAAIEALTGVGSTASGAECPSGVADSRCVGVTADRFTSAIIVTDSNAHAACTVMTMGTDGTLVVPAGSDTAAGIVLGTSTLGFGTSGTNLGILVGATRVGYFGTAGFVWDSGEIYNANGYRAGADKKIYWNGRSQMTSTSDGVWEVSKATNVGHVTIDTTGTVKSQDLVLQASAADCTFPGGGGDTTCVTSAFIPLGASVIQITGRQVTPGTTCTTCTAGANMGAGLDADQYGTALECDVNDTAYTMATATANAVGTCLLAGGCTITMTAVGGNCVSGVAAWTAHYFQAAAATVD